MAAIRLRTKNNDEAGGLMDTRKIQFVLCQRSTRGPKVEHGLPTCITRAQSLVTRRSTARFAVLFGVKNRCEQTLYAGAFCIVVDKCHR